MAIIDEVKHEFFTWTHARRYAPTIHALKAKLEDIKTSELNYQKKKLENFDENHADIITTNIIQKITAHFATHFKNEETDLEDSIEWIGKVFQLETVKNG